MEKETNISKVDKQQAVKNWPEDDRLYVFGV